ncbi:MULTISPECIES: cytochrome P450 [unclassified Actinopolyspora]|uniref:cytochrome P450 n=1 Tax=unclassified Actinopolyspora TaxID=2639451 RepID=UPI0013F640D0|nr:MULTISPECIES: cytochrome P450 [unclassified Actinopolyspora]NHD15873.1 cytochrome P450 [Actinopolyspora sp. BKK2]NHE74913.1 cytochrome P450 [Actinopolyspora sp. BKK1]
MSSTVDSADGGVADVPEYPMTRAAGCPFDPPPELREKQRQAPLARVRLWDGSTPWLVTRHAEQRKLLADPRVSADPTNPGYPSPAPVSSAERASGSPLSFILMDDPEHARLRRMVTGPFSVKRVEALRPKVQRIVDEAIEAMLAGPNPVDLVESFALPVPSLVICELLGVPYSDHDFFQRNSRVIVNRNSSQEDRSAATGRLTEYLDGLVGDKLVDRGEDLLSDLAERVEAGELPRDEAARMGVLLLIAGHETTANMIALGTLALLEHPDQLEALRETDDPELVSSAVEELLRYLHITHNGRRRVALDDIDIAGETIRAGEGLIVANDIGNRDPEVFDEPDSLDIRRGNRRHMAFGFGVHQCLGQPLARLELQVVYGTLYRRVPTLRLAVDPEEIPFKHDGSVYGVYELPVTW